MESRDKFPTVQKVLAGVYKSMRSRKIAVWLCWLLLLTEAQEEAQQTVPANSYQVPVIVVHCLLLIKQTKHQTSSLLEQATVWVIICGHASVYTSTGGLLSVFYVIEATFQSYSLRAGSRFGRDAIFSFCQTAHDSKNLAGI